ncbi:MAG: amidase [Deltaproteobacteria bacterium]|nr:amidase [Deltaproteobacteria bacterium]
MESVLFKSITELGKSIRNKEVSSQEVLDSYLKRIVDVNPKLNAVVQISEETAHLSAIKADEELAKGKIPGPLHGIPMTIKDSFDTKGIISTGGTKGREHFVPSEDATVVNRLRNAGAILIGKTNTSELTLTYETDNLIYGKTNNPYNTKHSSGG